MPLIHYQRDLTAPSFNISLPGAPAGEGSGGAARFLNAALGAGEKIMGVVAKETREREDALVSDSVFNVDRRFAEWKQ